MNIMNTYQQSSPSRDDTRARANEIYRHPANNFRETVHDPADPFKRKTRALATAGESWPRASAVLERMGIAT